jgi:hypothetical protein
MPEQRKVRLLVEQLENRCVPAGNVALSLFDPTPGVPGDEIAYIVGDDLSNNIIVAVLPLETLPDCYDAEPNANGNPYFDHEIFSAPGRWLLVFDGDGTTRVTGGMQGDGATWAGTIIQDNFVIAPNQPPLPNPRNASRIIINLAEGADTVQINYFDRGPVTLAVPGRGRLLLPAWSGVSQYLPGGGNDSFVVDPGLFPDVFYRPNCGNVRFLITHDITFPPGGVQLNMGTRGDKLVNITGATFLGSLSITTGDGDDSITLVNGVSINADLQMALGRGNNSVRLETNIAISGHLWLSGSEGNDSLTLDGSAQPISIDGNLNFIAGNGNNLLSVLRANVDGQLNFRGGNGNDRILLRQSDFGIGLDIRSGAGADLLEMFRSTMGVAPDGIAQISGQLRFIKVSGDGTLKLLQSVVHGDLFTSLNAGNDSVVIQNSQIDGLANVYTYGPGADRDVVAISSSRFYSPLAVRTGGGNDTLSISGRNQFFGNVLIDANAGNDVVSFMGNSVYANLVITLGSGDDYANISNNGFFGTAAVIDGQTGRDRIFQTRNRGPVAFRNFP